MAQISVGSSATSHATRATAQKRCLKVLAVGLMTVLLCFSVVAGAQALPLGENDASRTSRATTPQASTADIQMFRLYNKWNGEHFYTSNTKERDSLRGVGWAYEGTGWTAPAAGDAVYRLYNPFAGDHHYTTSANERDMCRKAGWRFEGIGWYSSTAQSVKVYREYNPNAVTGTHNYTTSKNEHDNLVRLGWKDEGIAWYGVASSSGNGSQPAESSKPATPTQPSTSTQPSTPTTPSTPSKPSKPSTPTEPPAPTVYTITYDLDGGTANTAGLPTTYTSASDTINIALPTPTKANYKFYRWENAAGEPVTTLTIPKGSTGNVKVTAKWMTTLNVEYVKTHTPQEIANYIASSNFNPNMPDGNTLSDISKGDVGSVSQVVQNNALAGFNIIRYLAGVNPVTFDEGAYNKAQAGAAYMAYTGTVTHYPDRKLVPDSTPADVFDRAVHGCGESNVVAGNGIANVVIGSFVPDPGNIANGKGHRRFCLNPALKSAAFGSASNRHADGSVHGGRTLYVMNEGAPYNQHFTVWPPSNMPMEYYPKVNSQRTYWTVCLHRQGQITAQAANLRVTLKYDGKTVTLRPGQGDCYFNAGTLMWRIDRDVKAGDKIEVKVEGVTDTSAQRRPVPIEYTVNFFNLSDYQAN